MYFMAIGNAVQRGTVVYIYNEDNKLTGSVPAGNGPNDGLKGYTPSRVNVQRGSLIYSYNENGQLEDSVPAR